jgi:predicted solute-binding protein
MTSAFLALKLYEHHLAGEAKSGICYTQVPFDKIVDEVKEKKVDAASSSTKASSPLPTKACTRWWIWENGGTQETDLPLALGAAVIIRRDLDWETIKTVAELIQEEHRLRLNTRKSSGLRPALRARHGRRAGQDLHRHVRE